MWISAVWRSGSRDAILSPKDSQRESPHQGVLQQRLVQGTRTFVRDMQMFHGAIDRLAIPMLSMVPTEDGLFDIDEYRQLETRNPHVSVLPVPESADLLIYQRTDFIMDRIIEIVTIHHQPT
jgi:hypothetical protein